MITSWAEIHQLWLNWPLCILSFNKGKMALPQLRTKSCLLLLYIIKLDDWILILFCVKLLCLHYHNFFCLSQYYKCTVLKLHSMKNLINYNHVRFVFWVWFFSVVFLSCRESLPLKCICFGSFCAESSDIVYIIKTFQWISGKKNWWLCYI